MRTPCSSLGIQPVFHAFLVETTEVHTGDQARAEKTQRCSRVAEFPRISLGIFFRYVYTVSAGLGLVGDLGLQGCTAHVMSLYHLIRLDLLI